MNICAVTVTYENRFDLLSKVLNALLLEKVSRIVVVDNASSHECRTQLAKLPKKLKNILTIVHLHENTGSAGGFKKGLETASSYDETEFIWLLDDDNVPEKGALLKLQEFWSKYETHDKENRLCLLSNRIFRPAYKIMAKADSSSLDSVSGIKNSFLGFNLLNYVYPGKEAIKFNTNIREDEVILERGYGHIPVAPYGGMFFHKNLLTVIGLPDERFYLYCDDLEFSSRIIKNNGEIILVEDSKITDIGGNLDGQNNNQDFKWDRLYYSTRNLIYIQKKLTDNIFLFKVNSILFISAQKIKRLLFNLLGIEPKKKSETFFEAISDGICGRMGKRGGN